VEILKLVDLEITKSALGHMFMAEDHPNYVGAGNQILRKFLDRLIIYLRGERYLKSDALYFRFSFLPLLTTWFNQMVNKGKRMNQGEIFSKLINLKNQPRSDFLVGIGGST
jgi:hypothetical protein